MRVLVACEFSGAVRSAFRALGHDAWSCDLLPAEDGSEFHIQGNVIDHDIEALRAAVGRYDGVVFVPWGQSPRDAVEARYREKVGV